MAPQHDGVISNASGAAVRADLNNALAALITNSSGASTPGTTYAFQFWADTTTGQLKIRNAANSAWIVLMELDGTMLMEDGTVSAPGLAFASDLNTGFFRSAADKINFATNGVERLEIGSAEVVFNDGSHDVDFRVESNSHTHMLCVDAGLDAVGIGTGAPAASLQIHKTSAGADPTHLLLSNISSSSGTTSSIYFAPNLVGASRAAKIAGINENAGNATALTFFTNPEGNTPAERMRITSSGHLLCGKTSESNIVTTDGTRINSTGGVFTTRTSDAPILCARQGSDGNLIEFYAQGNLEGSISVSGTSVSYNGGHLTRWSQLASGAERTTILRGSVLSNLDEMCEWGEEDNEQLNRMQLSNVEGDVNVSGVFQAWDDDDDTYINDFYCAMTGDFVIRIAQGTTVARGDLLMSAGDGTAKPQDDDIVRSKTIAKVTSTTVSTTYSDNSYCVPCVLMAC
tara:strand:- start:3 stop:1376 length:1374 start_codon:yes stop_codon:yes gene_type:complete